MQKQIWKNYFDIVILPPPEVSDYARALSKELGKHEAVWTLGKHSFIPHISLYHIPIKPKDFSAFILEIKRTIKDFQIGTLTTTIIEPNLLVFDKPLWIQKLHKQVIYNTLKYYDWDYHTDAYWRQYCFPKQMEKEGARFIHTYGTPMMGRNFKPHITLTNFKNTSPHLPIKKVKPFKFKPTNLFLCELGPFHSCQKIVQKIPFRQK